jgi:pyrimidine-nucleoside phosphorylase
MRAVNIIRKKRDGGVLTPDEIRFFVSGVVDASLPDYQAAAFLMAVFLNGMTPEETSTLTDAMVDSGVRLDLSDLPGPTVDKHSTGGVGDKSSLVVAPLVSACGAFVPMMSGRGLGHTGGTLDKLESIPGFRTNLSTAELRAALREVGCAMIGQTSEIAPADKKLYAIRDVTGTIENVALISASIMSKKIAEGIGALVLDVKTGRGAFMKALDDSRRLAASLVRIGNAAGVNTQAVITSMDRPIGRAVGNAIEVIESFEVLKGGGPPDLIENCLELSQRMLVASGLAKDRSEALARCHDAIGSGAALERMRAVITRQGGDPRVVDDYSLMPSAPRERMITANLGGFVTDIDAELVGRATVVLGGGRATVEDEIDPSVGIEIAAVVGEAVQAGEPLLRVHYRDESRLTRALPLLTGAVSIGHSRPALPASLIIEEVL